MLSLEKKDVLEGWMYDLYLSSFSEIEKIPSENLMRTVGRGGEILALCDGCPVGMMFSFTSEDITFLVYFAIKDDLRSKGYGSQALKAFIDLHRDNRIFLVMEPLVDSPDLEIRRRRHDFYLRNGCRDADLTVISDDAPFHVMIVNGELGNDEIIGTVSLYEDIHNGRISG